MTNWLILIVAIFAVIGLAIGLVWTFGSFLEWMLAR